LGPRRGRSERLLQVVPVHLGRFFRTNTLDGTRHLHVCANGNTLSDPSGKSYSWDFENRLTQAVVPGTNGGTTTFKYDPFGRRIYKQSPSFTSVFVYDRANLIETLNASGAEVASCARTQQVDETLGELRSGTTDYYEADGVESTTFAQAGGPP
jgi:YD repeat-containing protein